MWQFAKSNDFAIVSKDEDFNLMSVARGIPPKVVWLLLGNCSTAEVEATIRGQYAAIERFANDPDTGTLVVR